MEQLSSDELQKFTQLYRAKKVTIEIARDRGFTIGENERILSMSLEQFLDFYLLKNKTLDLDYEFFDHQYQVETQENVRTKLPDGQFKTELKTLTNLLLFKFSPGGDEEDKQFGIGPTKEFIEEMKNTTGDNRTGVLIIEQPLSSTSKKAIETGYPFMIQVFQLKELQYNPTFHMFAPKYRILSNEEKRDLTVRYKIQNKQLPLMSVNDPIAKYFGLSIGRVIEKTAAHFIGETMTDEIVEYSAVENTPL